MCWNTSTCRVLRNTVSTVKKSQATMPLAWAERNWRQVGPSRRGAGPRPARRRIVRIVVAETMTPKPRSSPLIRTHPQRGFSLAMRRFRDLVSESMGGASLCTPMFVGPLAPNELSVPPQKRGRGHDERRPALARQHPAHRREEQLVPPTELGAIDLPAKHGELMAQ